MHWTFHAKGIWIEDSKGNLTLSSIGSTNFASRSVKRDTELNFYLYSECESFQDKLRKEREHLFKYGEPVTLEKIKNDKQTKHTLASSLLSKVLRSFL